MLLFTFLILYCARNANAYSAVTVRRQASSRPLNVRRTYVSHEKVAPRVSTDIKFPVEEMKPYKQPGTEMANKTFNYMVLGSLGSTMLTAGKVRTCY